MIFTYQIKRIDNVADFQSGDEDFWNSVQGHGVGAVRVFLTENPLQLLRFPNL
jgi:hypothetical protein